MTARRFTLTEVKLEINKKCDRPQTLCGRLYCLAMLVYCGFGLVSLNMVYSSFPFRDCLIGDAYPVGKLLLGQSKFPTEHGDERACLGNVHKITPFLTIL